MLFINLSIIKLSIFYTFLFSYFLILLVLITYILTFNLISIKYVSELKTSTFSHLEYTSIFILLSFSGIPPFFFFFVKYALISNIIINGFFHNFLLSILLIFLAWFLYFTAVKHISISRDNRLCTSHLFRSNTSSYLLLLLFASNLFLLIGFFCIYDIFIATYFMNV